jgi:hypothetical protein
MLPGGFGLKIFEAEDRGEFAPGKAALHLRSFFRAGVDTTIGGIGHTLHLLARHPDQYALLHADPARARNAFEEGIRLESPALVLFRTTSGEVELSGCGLKADTKVAYYPGAANRDPRKWMDPQRFDITRDVAGVHRAFGYGAHACIGQMIARLEAECIIGAMAKRAEEARTGGRAGDAAGQYAANAGATAPADHTRFRQLAGMPSAPEPAKMRSSCHAGLDPAFAPPRPDHLAHVATCLQFVQQGAGEVLLRDAAATFRIAHQRPQRQPIARRPFARPDLRRWRQAGPVES